MQPGTPPDLSRRISLKNYIAVYAVLAVWAAAAIGAGIAFKLALPLVFGVGLVIPAAVIAYTYLEHISTEYRLYEDSIEVESGIIARKIDNLQLFRVRDIGFEQSVMGRILNFGNVTVTSTDQSQPHLKLKGVDQPRDVYNALRDRMTKSQAVRRTMIVESEPAGLGDTNG
jgi:uncharacterized membrane protein YdbT with pleckstrin-like domain